MLFDSPIKAGSVSSEATTWKPIGDGNFSETIGAIGPEIGEKK